MKFEFNHTDFWIAVFEGDRFRYFRKRPPGYYIEKNREELKDIDQTLSKDCPFCKSTNTLSGRRIDHQEGIVFLLTPYFSFCLHWA